MKRANRPEPGRLAPSAGLCRRLAPVLLVAVLSWGCGDEEGSTRGSSHSAPTRRPGVDEILVPLSGSDPAHVVGASNFNRFTLLTPSRAKAAWDSKDTWIACDDAMAAGKVTAARSKAAGAAGGDGEALRRYLLRPPVVTPATRSNLTRAAKRALAGAGEALLALSTGATGLPDSVFRVRMSAAAGMGQLAVKRFRSAGLEFQRAARVARTLGWIHGEEHTLLHELRCLALQNEQVQMLAVLRRLLELQQTRRDGLAVARTRADLGCVYGMLANYARALDHLDETAAQFARFGRRRSRAHALSSMGLVYLRRSEYGPALDMLEKARALLASTKATERKAYVLLLLGNAYENMGDLDQARRLYGQALGLRGATDTVEVADLLGNLGSVHYHLRENDRAIEFFEEARSIFERRQDHRGTANALFNLGRVKKVQGGYRTALEHYQQALRLQESDSPEAARTLCAMAETHLAMGRPDDALAELRQALEGVSAGTAKTVEVELFVVHALAHLRKKQPGKAIEKIRRALDILMEVAAGLADEHVVGVREHRSWVFDTAIAVALKTERIDLAAEFLEHSRAGALLEGLGGRGARRGVPEDLVEAETVASHRLAAAHRRYQEARGTRRLRELREANAEVQKARTEYRTVQQRIQREAKRIASVFHPVPDSLADIRSGLDEHDVLVLYALLPFQAHALVVTHAGARVVWLGNTPDIREACEALRADSRDPEHGTVQAVEERLRALAQIVIEPLKLPAGLRRLMISPDGPLCYVPFPLLFGEEPVQVACLPSGTTLRLLEEERGRAGRQVLALGDPEYTIEHQGHSLQVYAEGAPLDPLPATRKEVNAITRGGDVRLLGPYASVTNLTEVAATRSRWAVIHLACHGLIDPRTPTLSALALTPDAGDDGFLTALEVYGLHLPADLVVLSGCNTGRGRFIKGEGLVGLMRAFMCAGAPRIVVSLWKVDDEATQALMSRFHTLWRHGGHPTAQALQQAQREIRREPKWAHPRYWGAWVLWGLPD